MFFDPCWRRASWQRKHLVDTIVPTSWHTRSETKRDRRSRIKISQGHSLSGQLPPYRTHLLKFAKSPKNISSSLDPCGPFYSKLLLFPHCKEAHLKQSFMLVLSSNKALVHSPVPSKIVNSISFSYIPVMAHRREGRSSKHSFINDICVC